MTLAALPEERRPAGPERAAAAPTPAEMLARRCDAMVASDYERASCAELIAAAAAAGAIVAVTAGPGPNTIIRSDRAPLVLEVPPVEGSLEDLGAGDVFAAAFFLSLSEGSSVEQATAFANAAAAVRMRGSGPQAIGGLRAIEERLGTSTSSFG